MSNIASQRRFAAGGVAEGFIASSNGNGDGTIDIPSGAGAGDIVLIAEYVSEATAGHTADQVPSGWTLFNDGTTTLGTKWTVVSNSFQIQVYWKILAGGESTITSAYSGSTPDLTAHAFAGPATITAAAEQDCAGERAANPAAQTVNASGGSAPLINVAVCNPAADLSVSPTPDNSSTGGNLKLETTYYASSPANWTVDDDGSGGSEGIASGYIELTT